VEDVLRMASEPDHTLAIFESEAADTAEVALRGHRKSLLESACQLEAGTLNSGASQLVLAISLLGLHARILLNAGNVSVESELGDRVVWVVCKVANVFELIFDVVVADDAVIKGLVF